MTKRYLRTILSMILAFAMTFTPIFSSGATIATAFALDDDQEVTVHDAGDTSEEADTVLPEDGKDDTGDAAPESADQTAGDTDATDEQEALPEQADEADEQADQEEATRTEYTYTDEQAGLKVTAVLEDAAAILDDAELIATPITSDSTDYNYQAYMDALNKDEAVIYDESNTLLLDIAFIRDGVEIQPASGKVSIDLAFLDSQLSGDLGAEDKSDISVIHLPLSGKVRDKYDTTADASDIEAADIEVEEITAEDNKLEVSVKDEEVSFELDSFSGIAITKPEFLANTSVTGSATNDYNFKSILGPGLYYGITAETFDQQSHIQSNFAVNLYKGNNQGVDPDLSSASGAIVMSDAEYNGSGYINMGDKNSGTVLLYTNKSGKVLNNPRDFVTIITEDTATIKANYVDPIISYGASMSSELLSHANTPSVTITKDDSKMVIDTTAFPADATIYIDGDSITNYLQDGKLRILKHPDQVIVFNFDSTSTLKLGRFWVGYPDMSEYTAVSEELDGQRYIKSDTPVTKGGKNNAIDKIASHIAWNCNSVTSLELSETTGMFLVPKTTATTKVTSTSSGWIVTGGKFTNTGGEWHSVYDELPDVDKANLNMKKTVDDKTPSMNQKFEFAIDKFDTSVKDNWKNLVTIQNDGGAINYSDNQLTEGWNVYRIQETKQADSTTGNYVIDSTVYYAAVKYENKGTETAKIMVASLPRYFKTFTESAFKVDGEKAEDIGLSNPVSELPATFKNYTASSQTELKVKKILDGKAEWGDSDEFTFILTRGTNTAEGSIETPMPKGVTGDTAEVKITKGDSPKTKTFGTITYTAAGTYNYTIQEVVPDEAVNADNIKYSEATDAQKADGGFVKDNITYDGSVHNVVVTVAQDETDKTNLVITSVKCDGRTTDTQEITNTYESQIGSGEIKVKKEIDGRDWKEGDTFTFTLTGRSGPVTPIPMPEGTDESTGTKTIVIKYGDENYTKSFGQITFTKAGTYAYTIKETKENIAGIIYDESEHVVTITVTPDSQGKLLTEYSGNVVIETVTNKYKATGEGEIKVKKTLSGRDWTTDDEFTFAITGDSAPEGVTDVPMPSETSITINKDDTNQTKSFGKITFTKAGTYTYTVRETKGTAGGIQYDETVHTVTIKVKDDGNGNLIADNCDLIQTVGFENSYSATSEGEIKVKKNLVGRAWATDDTFEFTITPVGDAPAFDNNTVTVTKNSTGYTESFGKVTFTKAGTYQWTVSETHKGETIDGIDYADSDKTVTITVVDNGKGELVAEEGSALVQTAEFTNNYSASGEGEVKVKKTLEGREWATDDSFEFTITPVGDAPAFENNKVTVTKNSSDYTESFGTVTFTEAGTYQWTVSEAHKGETIDGIDYADSDKTVTITVVDNGKGNLVAEEGSALVQAAEFTNNYSASGEGEIKVNKNLVGRAWATDDTFEFTITPVGDAPAFKNNTVTVTKNSTGYTESFSKVTFTKAGTYEWTVSETHKGETIDGVAYDSADKTVTIVVKDDGKGNLVAEEGGAVVKTAEFTNTYAKSGEGEVKIQKNLSGREWTTDDSFEFTIKPVGDAPEFKNNTVTVTKNSTGYTESFGKVKFTEAGTYQWTVSEAHKGETIDGIDYAASDKTVTITVVDDGKGNLVAEEGSALVQTAEFTNNYSASGEGEVKVKKTLEGREWATNDSFEFTITPVGNAPEFENDTVTVTKNSTGYTESFGKVKFTEAGTYQWTVSEAHKGETIDGIDYAASDKTVTITVVDDGKGNLVAEEGSALVQTAEFTNTYSAKGDVALSALKELAGRKLKAGEFSFELKNADGNVLQTKTNAADGTVTFDKIEYTLADVAKSPIKYTISEVIPSDAEVKDGKYVKDGVTYDNTPQEIKVTLVDNKDGTITATPDKTGAKVKFENSYEAKGEIALGGSKTITGRGFKDGDTATFRIEAVDNAPLPKSTEVTIKPASGSDATFSFGKIEYKLSDLGGETSKTFEYKVTESSASMAGATKDDTVINVKVTVTDNGDGTLTATADKEASDIVFTNKYAAQGEVVLSAMKELAGRKLKAGEFSFELKDADGKVLQTKTNASDGTVTFDKIEYTLADVAKSPIKYTISEVTPVGTVEREGQYIKSGVTYDVHEETITVTLVDNRDGTITATPDKTGTSVRFSNTYDAEGSIDLTGTKTIENRKFKEGDEWTFEIEAITEGAPTPDPGKVTITPTGGSKETIEYGTIEFTLSDLGGKAEKTFKYKVTESGTVDGVTNDSRTHTLTITVKDNGDGTLSVTKSEKGGGLSFINTYKPKKTVKTGDDTNLLTPVATFASSLLMLVLSFFGFRRNRRKEDEE